MALTGDEKEKLKSEYFDYVNNTLPQDLLLGIEKAMELYRDIREEEEFEDDDEEGNAICLIIDGGKVAFAMGDGLDVEGPDDEAVFYIYDCEMLETCAMWVKETGMNLSQEQANWLGDSISLAVKEGIFKGLDNFAVYGDIDYGAGVFDPFYESYGDDDDNWDDEDDDWEDDDYEDDEEDKD